MSAVRRLSVLAIALGLTLHSYAGTGRLIVLNNDNPGVGFNDPTPATPVGGNDGTTRGAQRLNAVTAAALKWQTLLDTNVDVLINVSMVPISGCTETSGVLAQASPLAWEHNFANAPKANVWYPVALANKLAGADLEPALSDLFVQFNLSLDDANCFGTAGWYLGLDANHGEDVDMFVVALHELAHGFGISGAATAPTFRSGQPAITDTLTYDETLGLRWDQMSDSQRAVSIVNTGNLTWDGGNVREVAPRMLAPSTTLTITAPALVAGNYDIGTASFGPPANATALGGRLIQVVDAANTDGPSTTDGCTAPTNGAAISGNIAVVDRGTCTFLTKARNAQTAGAIGLVVLDNQRTTCSPPGMANTDDASDINIPIISVSARDGDTLRPQFGAGLSGILHVDPTQLAGASKTGRVRLYAPCTIEGGSSVHHWDVVATPNLLMEPSVNSDLTHGVDLTLYQLLDIGWVAQPKTGRRLLKR